MKPALVPPAVAPPRTSRWIPVVLAALLALPAAADAQCPLGATSAGAASLAIRLKPGETHRIVLTSDETTTDTIMGQERRTHDVSRKVLRYDVLAPGPEGRRRVRITYESISIDGTAPGRSYRWSSRDTAATVPVGARLYAALVGHGYTVAMDPDGSNRHVEGWDTAADRLIRAMRGPGRVSEQIEAVMKKDAEEGIIGEAVREAVVLMPRKAAAVGASWSCTGHFARDMPVENEFTWTVESRRGGVTRVKVTTRMRSDSTVAVSEGFTTTHYAINGTGTSTMEIEDATGWIIRARSEMELSGRSTTEGPPMGTMETPMSMKTLTTTEPVGGG